MILYFLVPIALFPFLQQASASVADRFTSNTTSIPTSNPSIRCFRPTSHSYPVNVRTDCAIAIHHILTPPASEAPLSSSQIMTWGPNASYRAFNYRTCAVLLIPASPESTDKFALLDMAQRAEEVVNMCVGADYHNLGGFVPIGYKKVFRLAVTGRRRAVNDVLDGEAGG